MTKVDGVLGPVYTIRERVGSVALGLVKALASLVGW